MEKIQTSRLTLLNIARTRLLDSGAQGKASGSIPPASTPVPVFKTASQLKQTLNNKSTYYSERKPYLIKTPRKQTTLELELEGLEYPAPQTQAFTIIPSTGKKAPSTTKDTLSSVSTSNTLDTPSTNSRPITLPIVKQPAQRVLLRSESDLLPPMLPSLTTRDRRQLPVLKKTENLSVSESRIISERFIRESDDLADREAYYIDGLRLYEKTRDQKFQVFYQHLTKSFQVLKDLKSDRCVDEIDVDSQIGFQRTKRNVLALDLDETLIHCCNFDKEVEEQGFQFAVTYKSEKGSTITAKINLRPHLQDFLKSVSRYYDIVIYTASDRDYATAVVNFIDPHRKHIKDVFHRDSCFRTKKGYVVKDLRAILPNDLDRIVLVDNSTQCFAPQISNGIPIVPFTYDSNDEELLKLTKFLIRLKDQPSMPRFLEKTFRFNQYTKFFSSEQLLKFLSAPAEAENC
jgi:Dullard-like phosphatase family protein